MDYKVTVVCTTSCEQCYHKKVCSQYEIFEELQTQLVENLQKMDGVTKVNYQTPNDLGVNIDGLTDTGVAVSCENFEDIFPEKRTDNKYWNGKEMV